MGKSGCQKQLYPRSLSEQENGGTINRNKQMKGRSYLGAEAEDLELGTLVLKCWQAWGQVQMEVQSCAVRYDSHQPTYLNLTYMLSSDMRLVMTMLDSIDQNTCIITESCVGQCQFESWGWWWLERFGVTSIEMTIGNLIKPLRLRGCKERREVGPNLGKLLF